MNIKFSSFLTCKVTLPIVCTISSSSILNEILDPYLSLRLLAYLLTPF